MPDDVLVVAFYLPQFHRIPENDEWWGSGFTEWTNVKRAAPLFPGHYQPREPAEVGYYSLLDPAVRDWQADLARRFGVGAFCYYHYWFKGKKLLERPAEEVLHSGKPNFPFCLSWANEPWTRAWNGRRRDTLMPQDYGGPEDWVRHFDYLQDFWRDPRYIRIGNRPLFLVYRASAIPNCDRMLASWRERCSEVGLEGLYLVQILNTFQKHPVGGFDGYAYLEPMFTLTHAMPVTWRVGRYGKAALRAMVGNRLNGRLLDRVSYERVWGRILARRVHPTGPQSCHLGAYVDWDNTPRRGFAGTIFEGAAPFRFGSFVRAQFERVRAQDPPRLLFVNAWNEWAEGAYLEPDAKFGRSYLEALRQAVSTG